MLEYSVAPLPMNEDAIAVQVTKQLNVMNDNVAPPTSKKGNTVIRKITETTAEVIYQEVWTP